MYLYGCVNRENADKLDDSGDAQDLIDNSDLLIFNQDVMQI